MSENEQREPQRIVLDAAKVTIGPAWDVPDAWENESVSIERVSDNPADRDEVIIVGDLESLRNLVTDLMYFIDELEH